MWFSPQGIFENTVLLFEVRDKIKVRQLPAFSCLSKCISTCFPQLCFHLIKLFVLWSAGGVLHFHPDNVCSEDRDKVRMKDDRFLFWLPGLNRICVSLLTSSCLFFAPPSLSRLFMQLEDSPSPKRQRLSQQSMLDLSSAPPSTPSSPIRPWELPPNRRPHPHYMPERCHTPVRNRRRYASRTNAHRNSCFNE